jgi:AcrR family transcriptional regulator
LTELIADQPKAARLVLIDGLASGPAIREQVRHRLRLLETMLAERLRTDPDGVDLPRSLGKAITEAIAHVVTRTVRNGHSDSLQELVDPLFDWVLGFGCDETLDAFAEVAPPATAPAEAPTLAMGGLPSSRDRDLLISATLRLASHEGFTALTVSRIRLAAGLSRQAFDACFGDVDSCFLAALEAGLGDVVSEAQRTVLPETEWGTRTCLLVARVAASLAAAPDLAKLVFIESFEAGPASLRWHEDLISRCAEEFYGGAPPDSCPPPVVAEATMAVLWGLFADEIASGRARLLPGHSRRLAFVALVPALGAQGAFETIEASASKSQI